MSKHHRYRSIPAIDDTEQDQHQPEGSDMTFQLTETEIASGVTVDDVTKVRSSGAIIGQTFYTAGNVGPALGTAAARMAFGSPAEFDHVNKHTGYIGYKRA